MSIARSELKEQGAYAQQREPRNQRQDWTIAIADRPMQQCTPHPVRPPRPTLDIGSTSPLLADCHGPSPLVVTLPPVYSSQLLIWLRQIADLGKPRSQAILH